MFTFDKWSLFALVAQLIFFSSFAVQLIASEKKKDSIVTYEFWILRIVASVMLIIYFFIRRDIVFISSMFIQIIIYSRNIVLMKNALHNKIIGK